MLPTPTSSAGTVPHNSQLKVLSKTPVRGSQVGTSASTSVTAHRPCDRVQERNPHRSTQVPLIRFQFCHILPCPNPQTP